MTTFPLSSGAAENTKLTLNLLDRGRFAPFLGTPPEQSMDAEVAPDVRRVALRTLQRSIHPWADGVAFADIYGAIRRHEVDVVHTHNAKDGILGRLAAAAAGVPAIVHTIHNVSFQSSSSPAVNAIYAWAERWAARGTHRVLAVSRENVATYLRRGIGKPEQYRTVYSGLELERYLDDGRQPAERRTSLGLPDRPGPWVAWMGRFNSQKDPLTFVRAARYVTDQVPSAQFVVCGDDPLDCSLEAQTRDLIQDLRLSDRVHMLGFHRDVATVFGAVNIVLHSSRYEGMGRTLCEALACERAIAGTAVDGVVELVVSRERGGILAPPGQPDGLGAVAVELLQNPQMASELARAGREWVLRHLDARHMVKVIESIYEDLIANPRDDVRVDHHQYQT